MRADALDAALDSIDEGIERRTEIASALDELSHAEKNANALVMVDGFMAANVNADRSMLNVTEVTNLMLDLRNLLAPPTKGGEWETQSGEPTPPRNG